jgi:hypothetical protein
MLSAELEAGGPAVDIGASAVCAWRIDGAGVEPVHASVVADENGLWLRLHGPCTIDGTPTRGWVPMAGEMLLAFAVHDIRLRAVRIAIPGNGNQTAAQADRQDAPQAAESGPGMPTTEGANDRDPRELAAAFALPPAEAVRDDVMPTLREVLRRRLGGLALRTWLLAGVVAAINVVALTRTPPPPARVVPVASAMAGGERSAASSDTNRSGKTSDVALRAAVDALMKGDDAAALEHYRHVGPDPAVQAIESILRHRVRTCPGEGCAEVEALSRRDGVR